MTGAVLVLIAAALFGLSTPAAKLLVGDVDPWLVAGLLYLGSGVGLGAGHLARRCVQPAGRGARLAWPEIPWLAAAIVAGGVIGPVLLMFGLAHGSAARTALLLNLEPVFTALLAWAAFREYVGGRIAVGMTLIAAGAVALSWEADGRPALDGAALLVAGACLMWAIDNNLTRRVSGGDAVWIATLKGAVAGGVNVLIALGRGAAWPSASVVAAAGLIGLLGYGTSLALFVLALRSLGAARTGAYFATAPFVGAVAGVLVLHEPASARLAVAGALMAGGVALQLTERHEHEHTHEALAHEHLHRHDEHHRHEHPPGAADEPHSHWHVHPPLRHRHPHYPDLHHRHQH